MLAEHTKHEIEQTIGNHRVVLFMKGQRHAPQCGFSASVVDILDSLLDDYATVNVLADPSMREGIKEFSDWPTIPQLYVDGEFIGGADIVREMYAAGDLHKHLGIEAKPQQPPEITITENAAAAIRDAQSSEPGQALFLAVSPGFEHHLGFGPEEPNTIQVESAGIVLHLDPSSARRANGLVLDFVDGSAGTGFKIENPNAPPRVKAMSVEELKERLETSQIKHLYDVRTEEERAIAKLDQAILFDASTEQHIKTLPKDTPLVFMCHFGSRSQTAAQHFLEMGFRNVFNVEGGIDAWAQRIEPSMRRY